MKTICYIVPYFGKLPANFQVWLNSCATNETIDWIVFTNDKTQYKYPRNVKVEYCEFEDIQKLIKKQFDFEIKIDSYWSLSLFKPAYGEIFYNYIKKYDFWGHCDIDLIWGNIRKFISDDMLEKYEKIGYQGHSTLYKNNKIVNSRYKTVVPNEISYKDVFSGKIKYSFDENGMEKIYQYLQIPYYNKTNFAHLSKYDYSFYLKYLPKEEDYKNYRQVFEWNNGILRRYYIEKDKRVNYDEFMYLHFFCRPIKFETQDFSLNARYVVYPDRLKDFNKEITYDFINKYGKCSKIKYYITSIYHNRKKLTFDRIIGNIKRMREYRKNK